MVGAEVSRKGIGRAIVTRIGKRKCGHVRVYVCMYVQ